jgi:hypothetical protein
MVLCITFTTLRILGRILKKTQKNAPISSNTILGVCPPTWIVDSVLSTMATVVVMEVLSLSTTFGNE